MIRRCLNGATQLVEDQLSRLVGKKTQGTETSKYLEEKRTIVIPLVVASENGTALKCHNFYWNVFGKRDQRR